jgi:TonB family protein
LQTAFDLRRVCGDIYPVKQFSLRKKALSTVKHGQSSLAWLVSALLHVSAAGACFHLAIRQTPLRKIAARPVRDTSDLCLTVDAPLVPIENSTPARLISMPEPPPLDWSALRREETPLETVTTLADAEERPRPPSRTPAEPEGGNGNDPLNDPPAVDFNALKLKRSTAVAELASNTPGGSGTGGDGGMIGTDASGSGGGNDGGFGKGRGAGDGSGSGATSERFGASEGSGVGNGAGNAVGDGKGGVTCNVRSRQLNLGPYPSDARRAGIEGRVLLRLQVLKNGKVGKVEVAGSSGHDSLDRAACDAARNWTFYPAEVNGIPVEEWVLKPYAYKLTNR